VPRPACASWPGVPRAVATVAEPLQLPAPVWATDIDGEARSGLTWRRIADVRPLAEPDDVGGPRPPVEVTVERFDLIDHAEDGFMLTEGQLLFFLVDAYFDLEQFRRLHAAIGQLLDLVDPEAGAR
jgi:hypothetical protein